MHKTGPSNKFVWKQPTMQRFPITDEILRRFRPLGDTHPGELSFDRKSKKSAGRPYSHIKYLLLYCNLTCALRD